ncbi:MAG: DUF5658 family protein [Armatimonadota bacterium]
MPIMLKESWVLLVICTLDALSTYWLITSGWATEFNPIMNWVLGFGWSAFFGVKGATVLLAIGFMEWYRRHDLAFVRRWARLCIALYMSLWTVGVLVGCFVGG